jgi:hypothetical protein
MSDPASETSKMFLLTEKIYAEFKLNPNEIQLPSELNEISPSLSPDEKLHLLMGIENGRSAWTAAHSWRMGKIFQNISNNIIFDQNPLSQSDIALLYRSMVLHDIGKIAVPQRILDKQGELTETEHLIMDQHERISQFILKELGFTEEANIVVSHHQFQNRVVGRKNIHPNIPFEDRRVNNPRLEFFQKITTFVDEIDSFTNGDDRPYKNGTMEQLYLARLNNTLPEVVKELIYHNQYLSKDIRFTENVVNRAVDQAIQTALEAGKIIRATPLVEYSR